MKRILLIAAAVDACALLTAEEIEAVQRERPQISKPSAHSGGDLAVRQCFYQLPTFEKSISGNPAASRSYSSRVISTYGIWA